MERFNRAERRFQTSRLKAKRKNYYGNKNFNQSPKFLGKVVNTPKMCSCFMCGNARKYYGNAGISLKELSDKEFIESLSKHSFLI